MKRLILFSGVIAMSFFGHAWAAPAQLSESQMDDVVAAGGSGYGKQASLASLKAGLNGLHVANGNNVGNNNSVKAGNIKANNVVSHNNVVTNANNNGNATIRNSGNTANNILSHNKKNGVTVSAGGIKASVKTY